MALITILISLIVERFLGSLEELRDFGWFGRFAPWVQGKLTSGALWDGVPGVLLVLLPPVVVALLLAQALTEFWMFSGFLFALLVLLYSMGPRDLEAEVEAFIDAQERGDEESARWYAADVLGEEPPASTGALTRAMVETTLIEAHERLFGVLFWFVVLGPAGALLYRLSCLMWIRAQGEASGFAMAVVRIHGLLSWLPVRLCGLGFAISGSFVDAMHNWRHEALKWMDTNRGVLVTTGFGALQYAPSELERDGEVETQEAILHEVLALVRRTVLVWLALLALLTLSGWA